MAFFTSQVEDMKGKINYTIWVNYNDLTATSLESWLVKGIIRKWSYFRLVKYVCLNGLDFRLVKYVGLNGLDSVCLNSRAGQGKTFPEVV